MAAPVSEATEAWACWSSGRDLGLGQIGDGGQVGGRGLGQTRGAGIAVHQFEDPAGGEVLGEQGEFGEGQGQQMMELVDEAGALADDGLESSGDLAEDAEFE